MGGRRGFSALGILTVSSLRRCGGPQSFRTLRTGVKVLCILRLKISWFKYFRTGDVRGCQAILMRRKRKVRVNVGEQCLMVSCTELSTMCVRFVALRCSSRAPTRQSEAKVELVSEKRFCFLG